MVVNGRPLKRMKRRVTADLCDFLTFPSSVAGCCDGFSRRPFRANVVSFLSEHALSPPPSSLFPHLMTWRVLFRVGDVIDVPDSAPGVVCLDIVEEDVARSRSVYCDQCRVVGWSGHPVCGKRYHFIIKADGNSIGAYPMPCTCCGEILHLSDSRCKSCNHAMTTDDVEDWVYHQLEDTTHLLHGVVHSNGYGHLLRVNGREGGSRILSGCHIMNFWDRLCNVLGVRRVSVMDVSKKYGLEYRLLHTITTGHPWYGDWGYEFGAGSYALTLDAYKAAVESLSSLPLSIFLSQEHTPHTHLQEIISFYQSLSEHELVNTRDLFCFLTSLIHNAHKSSSRVDEATYRKHQLCVSGVQSSWTRSDIERVEEAMFRVLRAVSGSTWVSLRALRGAVCKVASPELLDHCLKGLRGKFAGDGMVVNTQHNPDSGPFMYRLEPAATSLCGITTSNDSSNLLSPSVENILQDVRYLYESLLHPQTMVTFGPQEVRDLAITSAEKLLDCKQFVKDYWSQSEKTSSANSSANSNTICLSCQVELMDEYEECCIKPPPELIVLSPNATVSDLKQEAAKAFQDVYLALRKFQAEELPDYSGVDNSTWVKNLLGSTEFVRIRGRCLGKNGGSRFRMERGIERWTVDCRCGAKDDDGERMLACDACGVWQHTRCSGIQDSESVPARFLCNKCRGSSCQMTKTCGLSRDETVNNVSSRINSSFGKSLATPSDVP